MAYPRRARREDAIKIDGACLRFSDTHRPRDLSFYRWRIKSPGCRPIRPSLLLICGAVFSNSRRAVRSTRIMAASWSTSGRAGADPGLTARAAKVRFGRVSRGSPVQTAMRNCTRDEGGPFGFGNQVLISSHCKLLRSKAVVVSVAVKSGQKLGQARSREASASEPLQKRRKRIRRCQNRGVTLPPGSARGMP